MENVGSAFGLNDWQPADEPYVIPPEVAAYTYAENWWDVTGNGTAISQPDAPYTAFENTSFEINSRITSDYNPYTSSLCEWDQNMLLLDMSIGELVEWSGRNSSGYTTTFWRGFDQGSGISVYTTTMTISAYPCGEPQSTTEVEPIMVEGAGRWIGISFVAMQIVMPPDLNVAGYLSEKVAGCNVFCNLPQTNRYAGPPSACVQLQIPIVFECSPTVRVVKNAQSCVCFDVGLK